MNLTYVHLLITHLPIMGSVLGALVLFYGLLKGNSQTIIASYLVFVASAMGGAVAYFTGESAEETVENLPGTIEASIKTHEEFAVYASVALLFLGLASIVGWYISSKQYLISRSYAVAVIILAFVTFILCARTGYLGGKIRHTELSTQYTSTFKLTLPNCEAEPQRFLFIVDLNALKRKLVYEFTGLQKCFKTANTLQIKL